MPLLIPLMIALVIIVSIPLGVVLLGPRGDKCMVYPYPTEEELDKLLEEGSSLFVVFGGKPE